MTLCLLQKKKKTYKNYCKTSIKEESRKKGLELKSKKAEVIVVSRIYECPQIKICINGNKLKRRDQFKYLDILTSSDERNNIEIASRIVQAKKSFQEMKYVLINKNFSIHTRRRVQECYIEAIPMQGCEAWTFSKQLQNKVWATEMWFLRRMLRISWTAKKSSEPALMRGL